MPELSADLYGTVSHKLDALQPSGIREFNKEVSKIPGIIKLTLGEPDMATPEHVKQAAIRSIEEDDSHYAPQMGKPELLEAISDYIQNTRDVHYDPQTEIIATVGATEALDATLFAILNTGDKVVVPTPIFSLYFPLIEMTGATVVQVDTSADNFVLTPEKLEEVLEEEGKGVKAVILNYPSNPTGREYPQEVLAGLAEVIKKHHLYAIADEIYSELVYGVEHYSIATMIPERTIFISGLSKSHAMTGYRLGYVAAPAKIMANISKMHAFLVTTVTNNVQVAAAEALTNGLDDPLEFRKIYQHRRDLLVAGLKKLGFEMLTPEGAFYLFAKIPAQFGTDDVAFAKQLAKEAKVGVTPGSAFGKGGDGYVRLSYASSDENLTEAIKRIGEFLNHLA
ncbi:aminotransferase class I/II-fold pyridoxal phosphate-dependent enzyme [Limosilactobacillus reuteri]|uniref:aminotransferase class I/II-fold pyridoxal phosphate-dependent enzyme n=1 Tax=Limosilactobacillus reuteri TaxID=1598 RepID=UPI001E62FE53|nr:aminotransferase class I/II-fold pyridoxal phosphate-dependent enzyme [Limosilactobacillus reuteri]MCC4383240.1 aminotransferase class I/II-fold pyridoxal phosphate-dependent enzyme [Limosilactobacillus reuteri]MCC4398689.1 aminotransferase class I/II-fold pyridoxal phosphate-dependent enzyme [Limosilactobacillus reuteri]MCC4402847.1 aminotransferase class I/II-fold pyridoxal phosphate-dependent enzyme [Limosilactobacillus reuteri]MCC4420077.1 aminotransferase class I/II-fold pyridoxal phosp